MTIRDRYIENYTMATERVEQTFQPVMRIQPGIPLNVRLLPNLFEDMIHQYEDRFKRPPHIPLSDTLKIEPDEQLVLPVGAVSLQTIRGKERLKLDTEGRGNWGTMSGTVQTELFCPHFEMIESDDTVYEPPVAEWGNRKWGVQPRRGSSTVIFENPSRKRILTAELLGHELRGLIGPLLEKDAPELPLIYRYPVGWDVMVQALFMQGPVFQAQVSLLDKSAEQPAYEFRDWEAHPSRCVFLGGISFTPNGAEVENKFFKLTLGLAVLPEGDKRMRYYTLDVRPYSTLESTDSRRILQRMNRLLMVLTNPQLLYRPHNEGFEWQAGEQLPLTLLPFLRSYVAGGYNESQFDAYKTNADRLTRETGFDFGIDDYFPGVFGWGGRSGMFRKSEEKHGQDALVSKIRSVLAQAT